LPTQALRVTAVPNSVFSDLGNDGKVCVYTQAAAHVVVDVNGAFPAGSSFTSLLPQRLTDTRADHKTVDGLFQEGIKNQPQNPLNYAAYAIYLKPRKRLEPKGFIDTYDEALANIDKAIKLWPDEPSFYITKIYILTAPHQAHEWMRSGALEDVAIHEHMDQVNDLFKQAERKSVICRREKHARFTCQVINMAGPAAILPFDFKFDQPIATQQFKVTANAHFAHPDLRRYLLDRHSPFSLKGT